MESIQSLGVCSQGNFNFATDNFSSSISFNVPGKKEAIESIEKQQFHHNEKRKEIHATQINNNDIGIRTRSDKAIRYNATVLIPRQPNKNQIDGNYDQKYGRQRCLQIPV